MRSYKGFGVACCLLLAVFVSLADVRAQGSEEALAKEAKKAKAAAMMDRYEKLYSRQRERRIVDDVKAATRATREVINETVVLGESGTGPQVTLTFTAPTRVGGNASSITSIINGVRNSLGNVDHNLPPVVRTFTILSGSSISIELECIVGALVGAPLPDCEYTIDAVGGTVGGQGSVTRIGRGPDTFVVVPVVVPN